MTEGFFGGVVVIEPIADVVAVSSRQRHGSTGVVKIRGRGHCGFLRGGFPGQASRASFPVPAEGQWYGFGVHHVRGTDQGRRDVMPIAPAHISTMY